MVAALRVLVLAMLACAPVGARAQDSEVPVGGDVRAYEGRRIIDVRVEGLERVDTQLARNQIRTQPGTPLEWDTVLEDLRRLERLGEFRDIRADLRIDEDPVTNPRLDVVVVFVLEEAPIVQDVVVVGNRQVTDDDIREVLAGVVTLIRGVPIDEFQIGSAQRLIEDLYRDKGYFQVQVLVDQSELDDAGVIAFRVREGERIKITSIRLDGVESFPRGQVRNVIRIKKAGLFSKGPIDEETLDGDVSSIIAFYADRGYLDTRAAWSLTPSPNGREAIVTFLVQEGPLYTLRGVEVDFDDGTPGGGVGVERVLDRKQIEGLLTIKRGEVFSQRGIQQAAVGIERALRQMGYADARVAQPVVRRDPVDPLVDVTLIVREGERFRTGMVYIQGNTLTQQKVIRRQLDIEPDRWLDATAADETQDRLRQSRLFDNIVNPPKVTIQPEDPANPGYRDVLIEVEETATGSISFGASIGSDAGVAGSIGLSQRNFDIGDVPDSWDEFFRGRAFRGAGQTFNLSLQPGNEVSNYSISLAEPAIFDSSYSLRGSLYFRQRDFTEFDQEAFGTRIALGRRFGTRWRGGFNLRAESVDISEISEDSAVDFFEIEGQNTTTGIGFGMNRSTLGAGFRPTRGTVTDIEVEQVGALGGDFDFTKITFDHTAYFPVWEDFLGRKTVVSVKGRIGWIPQDDEAPVFERFFLGGRTFRGFDFRGVGPNGVDQDGNPTDDKVGDDWLAFLGAQVERPLFRDVIAVVGFVDSGTITNDPGFEDWRVSVGVGIRLYIPQIGPAPLAFDFGFPIVKEDDDEERLFSFSIDLPFN